MLSSGGIVCFFSYHVSFAPFPTSSFVYTVVFLSNKYIAIIQKAFYTAFYYRITSSLQVSNKFINFGSWVNFYGLPFLWCSWQIVVMLVGFEAALFMCSKNIGDFFKKNYKRS